MARAQKYSVEEILDAAGEVVVQHGRDAAIAHVVQHLGIPTGSIYHRFASRDALFGALWARSIRRFHEGLVAASGIEDGRAAMAALAVHIPQFCRANPVDATAMALYRLPDLLPLVPESERADLGGINDEIDDLLRDVVERRFGRWTAELHTLALMATRQCPYGMVRPFLGTDVPDSLDSMCVAAAEGILTLGD